MNDRKQDQKQFTVVSLPPIRKGGWTFSVSANNYEEGILIIAAHFEFRYTTLKYFQDYPEGKRWLDSLVSLDEKLIASELAKLESKKLQNK